MSLEHVRFILKPLVMPDRTFSWDETLWWNRKVTKGLFLFKVEEISGTREAT